MGTARDRLGSRADAVTGESASDSMVDLHLGKHRGVEIWAAWEYWRGIEANRAKIHCTGRQWEFFIQQGAARAAY